MKRLVREKLAPWLHIRVSTKSMPSAVCMKDISDDGDFQHNEQQPQDVTLGSTDKLLMVMTEIRDLLKTKNRNKAEDCKKPVEDDEDKKDWKLAAAIFDRILLISFTIVHVGGTAIFFTIFIVNYHLK